MDNEMGYKGAWIYCKGKQLNHKPPVIAPNN